MNKKKQIDLIRKRNIELSKQINDMKFKLEFDSQLNMEGYKRAKDLISDLEHIKSEWIEIIEDLRKKDIEYSYLISELKQIKNIMTDMGFKIPVYKKIWLILKSKNKEK